MKKKHISILLAVIGISLLCTSVILILLGTNNMNIIGGADWSVFFYILFSGNNGLYNTIATLGVIGILTSLIIASKRTGVKNAAILTAPLLLFTVLRTPYSWINGKYIVEWLGCGCNPGFNANDFTRVFWAIIGIAVTVISIFVSNRVLKNKKWLRILYIAGIFAVSIWIAHNFYLRMMRN